MIYEVEVKKKHIRDAQISIVLREDECKWCPIALAMYEQIGKKKYKVVHRETFGKRKKGILFLGEGWKHGGGGNMFAVAKTIECNVNSIPEFAGKHWYPPIQLDLPKEVKQFVIDFDKGNPVKPFKFSIEIKP